MSDGQIILFMLAAGSFGVLAVIIYRAAGRVGRPEIQTPSVVKLFTPSLDRAAAGIVSGTKRLIISAYLLLLLFAHRLTAIAKSRLHQVENKFLTLIQAARGRGPRAKVDERRGAASFFLEQIKLDQVETRHSNRR